LERADIKSKVKMEFRNSPHEETNGFMPYITDENNIYTIEFQESIKRVAGEYGKVAYFSSIGDFNYLGSRVKVPTFIFGPNGKNFHSADEWVSIDSVVKTSNIIYDYLVNLLCK
jgi:succinyl-diaminopimelate desuccinylase